MLLQYHLMRAIFHLVQRVDHLDSFRSVYHQWFMYIWHLNSPSIIVFNRHYAVCTNHNTYFNTETVIIDMHLNALFCIYFLQTGDWFDNFSLNRPLPLVMLFTGHMTTSRSDINQVSLTSHWTKCLYVNKHVHYAASIFFLVCILLKHIEWHP
jgi:hypothetical protein